MAGQLWVVSTPIGNLGDITPRAVKVLQSMHGVAAEDDRVTRKLLHHLGLNVPIYSLHQANEGRVSSTILQRLLCGEDWAVVSDAGTPLIQDPGLLLVQKAIRSGVMVRPYRALVR